VEAVWCTSVHCVACATAALPDHDTYIWTTDWHSGRESVIICWTGLPSLHSTEFLTAKYSISASGLCSEVLRFDSVCLISIRDTTEASDVKYESCRLQCLYHAYEKFSCCLVYMELKVKFAVSLILKFNIKIMCLRDLWLHRQNVEFIWGFTWPHNARVWLMTP